MKVLKTIPNLLTLLNLLCGSIAVIFAVNNQIQYVVLLVMFGIFFDFLDGFAARLLQVQSELGKQLDSLADMVTSGLVPGVVMVQMLLKSSNVEPLNYLDKLTDIPFFAGLGFTITLASCYRLANFNIDENQKENFIGLPTPANTLFVLSLPLMHVYPAYQYISCVVDNTYALLLITLLSCYMLNAKIELFALKFKTFSFKDNQLKYLFLGLSFVSILVLQLAAIPVIIVMYLLLSLLSKKK